MSFALLLPLYLAGVAAVAAPVLVHLRQRPSAQPYAFSTLRFLLATKLVSSRRRKLLRRLLLALRVAAILLLVLAFARPWLGVAPEPAERATVLLVDVSASVRGERAWADARRRAEAALEEAGPHAAVIAMGRWPRVVRGFGDEALTAAEALASLEPTWESGDAETGLRRAGELLDAERALIKEVVAVSDFGRPTWSAVRWNRPLPAGVTVRAARPADPVRQNLALGEVQAPRTFWDPTEPLTVRVPVSLGALGSAEAGPVEVRLSWEAGEAQGEAVAEVSPPVGGSAVARFSLVPGVFAGVEGRVALAAGDRMPADDEAFFRVPAGRPLRLGRLKHPDTDDTFLRTAVRPEVEAEGPGDAAAPYTLVPFEAPPEGSSASPPEGPPGGPGDAGDPAAGEPAYDALVLDAGLELDAPTRAAVAAHAEAGGPVLLLAGARDDADEPGGASAEDPWEAELLGVAAGRARRNGSAVLAAGGARARGFGRVDLTHPVLAPFAAPRAGDLFAVEVRRWRALEGEGLRPLIRMPNGDAVLALAGSGAGAGRVAAFGVALDRGASSWPVESTFLPVLHQTLAWLTGRADRPPPLRPGDAAPGGGTAERPGLLDGRVVALDPAERAVEAYELDTFDRLAGPPADAPGPPGSDGSAEAAAAGGGLDFSPWLLLLAAAAAAAELLLSNRLSKT